MPCHAHETYLIKAYYQYGDDLEKKRANVSIMKPSKETKYDSPDDSSNSLA